MLAAAGKLGFTGYANTQIPISLKWKCVLADKMELIY
jgi:hypothetical protein